MRDTLQMIDPIPMALGRKVVEPYVPTAQTLKARDVARFEWKQHDPHITEADCRKPRPVWGVVTEVGKDSMTVNTALAEQTKAEVSLSEAGFTITWPKAETSTSELKADAGGWIAHDGKGCPLALGTSYEVIRFNGGQYASSVDGFDIASDSFWFGEQYEGMGGLHAECVKQYRIVA